MQSDDEPKTPAKFYDQFIGYLLDNRFEILASVSAGGFGDVLKVRHREIGKVSVAKIMRNNAELSAESAKRFQREAQILCKLRHQNIVAVSSFGQDKQLGMFLIMDWLDGVPLSNLLLSAGQLPVERACKLFIEICDGMSCAHDLGILHRDIKPSNIMIVGSGTDERAVIIDFGAGKLVDGELNQKLTSTGAVLGTPLYMSPEQCLTKNADKRSDVYAMGCLMYEVLTGKPPFSGESSYEIMSKHLNETPPLLSVANSTVNIPARLEQVVARALAKDPEARFSTFSEIKESLLGDLKQPVYSKPRQKPATRKAAFQTKKLLVPACVVCFSLLIGFVSMKMVPKTVADDPGLKGPATVGELEKIRKIFTDKGDYKGAEKAFREQIAICSKMPGQEQMVFTYTLDLARLYYSQDRMSDANVILLQLDKEQMKHPGIYTGQLKITYGQVLFSLQKIAAARDVLLWLHDNRNDVSLADRWEAIYLLTNCYIEEADYTKAEKYAQELFDRAEEDNQLSLATVVMAKILRKTGKPKEALAEILTAEKMKEGILPLAYKFDREVELALDYNATRQYAKAIQTKTEILSALGPIAASDSERTMLLKRKIEKELSAISQRR